MTNYILFYTEKELELQNRIIELKKSNFNTKEFEERLSILNERFSCLNKQQTNTGAETLQESETRILSSLSDLESDIQKAFLYFSMSQSVNNIENKFEDKNNQSEQRLDIYRKELFSIAVALNKIEHTNYDYLKIAQNKIYTSIYNLIKIEFRLFGNSPTLDIYLKDNLNQNYLIKLMNKDYSDFMSQNMKDVILNENTVNPDGSLNTKSLKELALNDRTFKNQVINELDFIDEQIDDINKKSESESKKSNQLKNSFENNVVDKRHHIKKLLKNAWSPILSVALITTVLVFQWKWFKIQSSITKYMTTIETCDSINGKQTINEYSDQKLGTTTIIDYSKVKDDGIHRSRKTAIITDNKETDPSKLMNLDIENYHTYETETSDQDSLKTSINEYRFVEIVTDIDENDIIVERQWFYYIIISILSNLSTILFAGLIDAEIGKKVGLFFDDRIIKTIDSAIELLDSIKKEAKSKNKYKQNKKMIDELSKQLDRLKMQYNQLYDKYESVLGDNKKLVRK